MNDLRTLFYCAAADTKVLSDRVNGEGYKPGDDLPQDFAGGFDRVVLDLTTETRPLDHLLAGAKVALNREGGSVLCLIEPGPGADRALREIQECNFAPQVVQVTRLGLFVRAIPLDGASPTR